MRSLTQQQTITVFIIPVILVRRPVAARCELSVPGPMIEICGKAVGGRSEMSGGRRMIRLSGGPGHGQVFYAEDWEERRRAARRMGRTPDDVRGWALAYRPAGDDSDVWIWIDPRTSREREP
jgi:hypothetical protein